jgi:hypothetical protein
MHHVQHNCDTTIRQYRPDEQSLQNRCIRRSVRSKRDTHPGKIRSKFLHHGKLHNHFRVDEKVIALTALFEMSFFAFRAKVNRFIFDSDRNQIV